MDGEAHPAPSASSLRSSRPVAGDGRQARTQATVFGLDVSADVPLPFLEQAPTEPTGRDLEISVAAEHTPSARWPDSAEIVCDQREQDGSVSFRIEAHPVAGYLIWGPTYGRYILSADGKRVQCMPGACAEWQRLLIAQVLPFAALLHGLEVFHASAVVIDGGAVAFVGPSRAGKTSVALALCGQGANFLADDVLALERVGEDLLGHPGTPVAGLDHGEAQRLAQAGGSPLEEEVVTSNARERIVRMRGAAAPARLTALFFLDRRRDVRGEPRFELAADPQPLLAATFNSVLTGPPRLLGLLEVCALLARLRVERVIVGPDVDAAALATAVQRRLGTEANARR
jgi:hypothetical protein